MEESLKTLTNSTQENPNGLSKFYLCGWLKSTKTFKTLNETMIKILKGDDFLLQFFTSNSAEMFVPMPAYEQEPLLQNYTYYMCRCKLK